MYKVFIVEDEPLIRDTLRNHILQISEQLPLSYSGEAGDGELALSAIIDLKPDIILTDIRMPFMDGLAFSREARKLLPDANMIFISGFDEFEYAKAAIQVQAADYLLKPIKSEDLFASLARIVTTLDKQKAEQVTQTPSANMVLELKKNHLLNGLFNGKLSMSESLEKMAELSYSFIGKKMTVLLAQSHYNQNFDDYTRFSHDLNLLFKDDSRILYSSISSRYIKFLVLEDSEKDVLAIAYQSAQILMREFQYEDSGAMTVSIGPIVNRVSEIPTSYQTAKNQLYSLSDLSSTKLISYEHAEKENIPMPDQSFELKQALAEITEENRGQFIQNLLVPQNTHEKTLMYRFFVLVELKSIAQKREDFPQSLIHQLDNMEKIVQTASHTEYYQQIISDYIQVFIEFKIPSHLNKHNNIIKQALQFIQENFSDPDISLNTLAQEVALSPSHFSTVFSQAMGKTFIDYLTDQRIQLAKQLLKETNLKLAEITFQIGYNDPNYFSFLFKKKQGLSPTEYRNK